MKKLFAVVLTLAALLGLAACGGEESAVVATDGSTSMEKVVGVLGESFTVLHPQVSVTYNPTGSGAGLAAVSEGRCDIGLSSRELSEEEAAAGLTPTLLAYDAIAVVVSPDNPVSSISLKDLTAVYQGSITNWQELGGEDAEIVLIGREAGSGTRDGFEAAIASPDKCAYRQELTSTGDVIATVAQNPQAIGYASLAAVKDSVKTLGVDDVLPSESSVKNGSYPIQRPFLLVTKTGAELSQEAQAFIYYALSPEAAELIAGAGAVPAI